MLAISLMQMGVIMGDSSTQIKPQLFWANFVNGITVLLAVYTLLWFALAYTEHDQWINRWTVGTAVCHIILSGVAVTVSPEFLYEVTGQSAIGPLKIAGITFEEWIFLERNINPSFIFIQLYGYILVLISSFLIARYVARNRDRLYVGQITTLGIGIATPVLLNTLVLLDIFSLSISYTTISMGVTSAAFAVAIFRYRLFRLAPVGRKQLIDGMDDPVVMIDTDNRVVDCNRAAQYLTSSPQAWRGMSTEEFFSPLSAKLTHPEDFSEREREISHTWNGESQYFDPNVTTITTEKAGSVGHIIVLREITDQHKQRARIEKQNKELEKFAEMVSHDLRNPLTVAEGRLELAREESDSAHLDDASDAIQRSQALIDDLLMLTRSDEALNEMESVSLSELAKDCWSVVPAEDVTLHIETNQLISADPTQLRQVLENIFRNAVEHGDADNITVGKTTDGFYIADDGVGLSDPQDTNLFEDGYSTDDGGTGLGLQIVHQVVSAHGWEIKASQSDDIGAKFEISNVDVVE
jgi:signal transduction histidine kinase